MSSGFTSILPEEFHALIGVSDKAFRLYIYLRQYMIRSTGTASGSGITWPDIARTGLYIAPGQGVQNAGMPDKRKMMRLRDELIRGGLIVDGGDKRHYLAFYFPIFMQHRDQYFSARNKPAPIPHPKPAPIPHPDKSVNTGLLDNSSEEGAPTTDDKPAPYTEEPNSSINQSNPDRIEMSLEWSPSEFFVPLAKRSMIDIEGEHKQLYADTVTEFVLFWTSPEAKQKYSGKATRSQRDWERALLQTLQRNKNKPAPKAGNKSGGVPDEYRVPKDDNNLVSWAEKHGYLKPGSMTYYEYRGALFEAVRNRRDGKPVVSEAEVAAPDQRAQKAAEQRQDDLAMQRLAAMSGTPVDQLRKKV